MKRKYQLILCVAVVTLLTAACSNSDREEIDQKPNILWITIEDTSPQFIGCYGDEDARTPFIDELAAEGVRFTNAFSTGTVCSPSRSAIITGVRTYELGTGNHRSNYAIPEHIRGFPYYLQELGYYTSNNSKTDYNVANMKEFIQTTWHESSNKAGWWNREPGQPFFAVFNLNDSHQSRTMTNKYSWYVQNVLEKLSEDERIGEDEFEMPPFYRDSPEMRKQFARVYNSIKLTDNNILKIVKRLEEDHLRDSTIIFVFADHGEGEPRGKTNGINLGYRVPFVAWFPEMYKHLSPWGTGGIVTDEMINFEDLAPTLISLAGGEPAEHLKGRALMGKKREEAGDHMILSSDRADNGIDMVRSVTDGRFLYSRNYMPFMPQQRYIRYMEISDIVNHMRKDLADGALDNLQKSIFEERPHEFLFDIDNDTWETRNLAEDPGYSEILAIMRKQLDQELLTRRDVMFLPEYELERISETSTPYEFRLDRDLYPLEDIYAAASLSGKRSEEIAGKQVTLLKNKNSIIRYWAMIGLRSQTAEVLLQHQETIEGAVDDAYPPVAITAAAIAFEQFQSKKAEELLKEFCKNEDANLALMAVNYLLYIDNKAPFIQTIKAVVEKDPPYNVKASCLDFLGISGLIPNNPDYQN